MKKIFCTNQLIGISRGKVSVLLVLGDTSTATYLDVLVILIMILDQNANIINCIYNNIL